MPLDEWLRTALLALLAALLLDHVVTTTPTSSAVGTVTSEVSAERGKDPRRTRGLFVDKLMPAAQASKSDARLRPIGNRPQALWITDHYKKKVRRAVRACGCRPGCWQEQVPGPTSTPVTRAGTARR